MFVLWTEPLCRFSASETLGALCRPKTGLLHQRLFGGAYTMGRLFLEASSSADTLSQSPKLCYNFINNPKMKDFAKANIESTNDLLGK